MPFSSAYGSADPLEQGRTCPKSPRNKRSLDKSSLSSSRITAKRDQIASAVFRIETVEGAIPRALKQRFRQIETKRRTAFRIETNGDQQVSAPLEEILADALELEEQLLGQFTVPGKGTTATYRFIRSFIRVLFAGSFAILCSIVAAYVFAVVLPEGSSILNTSRSFWSAIMELMNY